MHSLTPPRRIIIDTDPGIDDVVTLALAARSPELQILAVTTTFGNAPLPVTTRNAHIVLRVAGRPDIPVYPGAYRPLERPLVTAPETHGPTGVGYAPVRPATPRTTPSRPTALLDVLRDARRPVTLVTLGPLTNLAVALAADADLVHERVASHLGMFGNLYERGNTNRWADFNAWSDPEAADLVIRSDLPTHMVGLDVTRRMVVTAAEVDRLTRSADPLVAWLAQAMQFYVEFHRSQEILDGCVINDVLTVSELLSPGILAFERKRIRIDLDENEHRGHTRDDGTAPVRAAMSVNVKLVRHLLGRVFGKHW